MIDFSKALTVRQLKEALDRIPDDTLPVITEGCDCFGVAASVEVATVQEGQTPHVCIMRSVDDPSRSYS